MVNPISPSDEPEPILGPDLSNLSEAQNQSLAGVGKSSPSGNTEEVTSGAFDTLSRISGARSALSSLLDKLSVASGGAQKTAPSVLAETTGTGSVRELTEEEAKAQFEEKYNAAISDFNGFKNASTLEEAQNKASSIEALVDEAKNLATQITDGSMNDKLEELEARQSTIQEMMGYITKMDELATKTEALIGQVQTATTIDVANNAVVDASLNSAAAAEIMKKAEAMADFSSNQPPILSQDKSRVDSAASRVVESSKNIQAAADAVEEAETILRETQANASPSKISSSIEAVEKLKDQVQTIIDGGDKSPAVLDALNRINGVLSSLEELQNQYDEITSGIVTGGSGGGAGSTQNKASSVGEKRVGFLLDAADSQTASIIMDGFRKMIDLFHEDNPDVQPTLRGVIDKLNEAENKATKDPAFSALDKSGAIDAMKAAVAKSATAEAQAAAMGAIAQAAAAMGGVSPVQAAQIGAGVAGVSAISSSPSSLSSGYDSFSRLNESYASTSSETRQLIDSAASRALERPLLDDNARRNAEQALSRSEDSNSRMTRDMLAYTENAGTLFGALSAYESLAQMIKENPNANLEEIKQKLTAEVSKAPKYEYPHMQLPKEGAQKFIQGLTEDFVEGTKQDLEKSMNQFKSQPMFVQQFLVNVASFIVPK
ncbi:hypothetical protein [Chlamydiifrater phoenicopteri]|uniref:hypothetical protein n=1 Tax=Chlamydiifrater phoenicopteri TaxID=2681469 RepID=UPI001BCDD4AE|nr:hypothetical protein [Chlamydiifrater phoenicopteri]